jgi:nonsense-mediated mRNA decay protein 3
MMSSRQLVEYVVLDIEPLQGAAGSGYGAFAQGGTRWCLAEAQVARKSDFGRNDTVFYTKTHLGHILHPGGLVSGKLAAAGCSACFVCCGLRTVCCCCMSGLVLT